MQILHRISTAAGVLFALFLALTSCRSTAEHPTRETKSEGATISESKVQPPIQRQSSDENWDRMRQCAEQADRVARREGWVGTQKARSDSTVLGWWNHYSPKYGRCYMQVSYLNEPAKRDKRLPEIYYELHDAFENNYVATCTDATNSGAGSFCHIEGMGPPNDCSVCRAFVKERMSK